MEDKANEKAFAASFLLGTAYANMMIVQKHLTMDETKEALSKLSEGIRFLHDKIESVFYKECKDGKTEPASKG